MSAETTSVMVIPISFECSIISNNKLFSNNYFLKLDIDPLKISNENIGLGFQRIKYISDNYLHGSIFLQSNKKEYKCIDKFDNNLVYFPCEIYDIYVGSILLAKFQTITNKFFLISQLCIASSIGSSIQYTIMNPYDINIDLNGDHWWHQDNVYTGSKHKHSWEELNLSDEPKFKPVIIKGGLSDKK